MDHETFQNKFVNLNTSLLENITEETEDQPHSSRKMRKEKGEEIVPQEANREVSLRKLEKSSY